MLICLFVNCSYCSFYDKFICLFAISFFLFFSLYDKVIFSLKLKSVFKEMDMSQEKHLTLLNRIKCRHIVSLHNYAEKIRWNTRLDKTCFKVFHAVPFWDFFWPPSIVNVSFNVIHELLYILRGQWTELTEFLFLADIKVIQRPWGISCTMHYL